MSDYEKDEEVALGQQLGSRDPAMASDPELDNQAAAEILLLLEQVE